MTTSRAPHLSCTPKPSHSRVDGHDLMFSPSPPNRPQENRLHSGIALMTPADVHYGRAPTITSARSTVLDHAYDRHPQRFVRHAPVPPQLADTTWINRPPDDTDHTQETAH